MGRSTGALAGNVFLPSISLRQSLACRCWEGGGGTIERVVLALRCLAGWTELAQRSAQRVIFKACGACGRPGRWVSRSLGQGIRNRLLNGTEHPGWALSGLHHTPASSPPGVSQKVASWWPGLVWTGERLKGEVTLSGWTHKVGRHTIVPSWRLLPARAGVESPSVRPQ